MGAFSRVEHKVDFCVVGGGMAGLCAALAAARRGLKVVLMHDRPVLGGNSSSECRVHICGADRHNQIKNMRETGILEELRLDNLVRNPNRNFSVWDTLLYEKARENPNLTLLLNCSCLDAEMSGVRIRAVEGWQLTTETRHRVEAAIFADCSGDGVLAPITGAEFRMGREGRGEYGESIAPERADSRTMGMTCLFQARKYDSPRPFEPPSWARRFDSCDELPYGAGGHKWFVMGYWWVELGGEDDSIRDTERVRDELVAIALGIWDHIKNRCPRRAEAANWALDWLQFLPAKRESRRYLGAHVLTENDIRAEGRFDDVVAYGGWTMDDHHPAGFRAAALGEDATIWHECPSPFGIPYRSLYSRNISNLMFAGRDASCTHTAMSSTRLMGTGCSMGQAVGTAVALALGKGIEPAAMLTHIDELQQALLRDDAYIPRVPQKFSALTKSARLSSSTGPCEAVRDGVNRPVGGDPHAWTCRPGESIEYVFPSPSPVSEATLILDSALDRNIAMSYHQSDQGMNTLPEVMVKGFTVEGLEGGAWREVARMEKNHQRFVRVPVRKTLSGLRFRLDATHGAPQSRVYAFYVD